MIRKPLLALVAVATLAGCSTLPATSVSNKVIPERTVQAVQAKVQPPSLAELKQILPQRLSRSEAKGKMILPRRDQLRVPIDHNRKSHYWFGLGYGDFGLYPFSYLGNSWYAPYYLLGGSWYPFSYSPYYLGLYPYMAYPFAYGLGCYSPYIYGFGAYGFPYGNLGYYPFAWPYSYGFYGWGWPGFVY
ncbi:MAG: lipoprotein [Cyanobacteria bacterium REEB65]|nr:lipoprotein [Cyanobacteria bacterium REEB65]